eukprot:m.332874 g.332874  ORF g.332874 m.332874 type:complete len:1046 (+) comp17019_c0_seq1:76-3213(+)
MGFSKLISLVLATIAIKETIAFPYDKLFDNNFLFNTVYQADPLFVITSAPVVNLLDECRRLCDTNRECKGFFVHQTKCESNPTCRGLSDLGNLGAGQQSTCPLDAVICASYQKVTEGTLFPAIPSEFTPPEGVACNPLGSNCDSYILHYQGRTPTNLGFAKAFPAKATKAFPSFTSAGDLASASAACAAKCEDESDCMGFRITYLNVADDTVPTSSSRFTCFGVKDHVSDITAEHVYSYLRPCISVQTCNGQYDTGECVLKRSQCSQTSTKTECPVTCDSCIASTTMTSVTSGTTKTTAPPTTTTVSTVSSTLTTLTNTHTTTTQTTVTQTTTTKTTTKTPLICPSSQWTCLDGSKCIAKAMRCNGVKDCGDESDELACATTTPDFCEQPEVKFVCSNSKCVPQVYHCNGVDDCGDGSDEVGCSTTPPSCPANFRLCKNNAECVAELYFCNGLRDCQDGSDEEDCSTTSLTKTTTGITTTRTTLTTTTLTTTTLTTTSKSTITTTITTTTKTTTSRTTISRTCRPDQFTCSNGMCIPSIRKCDLIEDCADGSDEFGCTTTKTTVTSTLSCEEGTQFLCASRTACILSVYLCNGIEDCEDGSDESGCTTTQTPCSETQFDCGDGCIPNIYRCNGHEDCNDGRDEESCTTTVTSTTITDSCRDYEFRCGNGKCIPESRLCDLTVDCNDATDELFVNCLARTSSASAPISSSPSTVQTTPKDTTIEPQPSTSPPTESPAVITTPESTMKSTASNTEVASSPTDGVTETKTNTVSTFTSSKTNPPTTESKERTVTATTTASTTTTSSSTKTSNTATKTTTLAKVDIVMYFRRYEHYRTPSLAPLVTNLTTTVMLANSSNTTTQASSTVATSSARRRRQVTESEQYGPENATSSINATLTTTTTTSTVPDIEVNITQFKDALRESVSIIIGEYLDFYYYGDFHVKIGIFQTHPKELEITLYGVFEEVAVVINEAIESGLLFVIVDEIIYQAHEETKYPPIVEGGERKESEVISTELIVYATVGGVGLSCMLMVIGRYMPVGRRVVEESDA